jgi:hypothetical protein
VARSNSSNNILCNLVLSSNPGFLRFWLSESVRDTFLSHVEHADLASLRLVCHDFSARAAPFLFQSLTVNFKASSFTKPSRVFALDRVGQHVKTLSFNMPHTPDCFLPPLIDPMTGEEVPFQYEPQVQIPSKDVGSSSVTRYGSWEMADLLIRQYPPLFHAATNVPAFVRAFSTMPNMTHLKISCPGQEPSQRFRRSIVDYVLISLRIAIERAPLKELDTLSLLPIHPGGLLYLQPTMAFGATPGAFRRWSQIKQMVMHMDSFPFEQSTQTEHLRILHAYLRAFAPHLNRLLFRWKGQKGPSPLSLDREPCLQPRPLSSGSESDSSHCSRSSQRSSPKALRFPRLEYMELENAVMDASQVQQFIVRHKRSITEFNFEDVALRTGTWDDALAPLTKISGSDSWKQKQEEVMDVPIVLSPVGVEPTIMGPLLEEQSVDRERGGITLSRWLSRSRGSTAKRHAREQFWGSEGHMRRFLKSSVFPWR